MIEIIKIQETYFLRMNSKLTISNLIKKVENNNGMKKGSFAEKYVIRILSDLLLGAIDLGHQYRKYYDTEYESFEIFLYKKELFENEDIDRLKLLPEESLWMLRFSINNYSIRNILGYDDENLKTINETLEYIDYET